jgi:basic membrane protein A
MSMATSRKKRTSLAMAALAALVLAACSSSSKSSTSSNTTAAPSASTAAAPTTASSATTAPGSSASGASFLACEVTDTGGINDRSFNASAYQALQEAKKTDPNITYKYLGSTSTSDYTPNINTFLGQGCGIIVTVGFDMGDATKTAAQQNPSRKFTIVDFSYTPDIPNVVGLTYQTNQDAFLGGYVAAAMSKSGAVGTFGGQNIPPVTIYMDGFVAGVRYYNQQNHTHVKTLGWTPSGGRTASKPFNGNGLFTNDFTNQSLGKTDAQTLISQGADVIFPVAGAVGLGAAAAVKAANAGGSSVNMEWVDTDGCVSAPQYCSLFITSVQKGITTSVKQAVLAAANSTFKGGTYMGNLTNGGVSLAPFHNFASKVPSAVQKALPTISAGIQSGKISVDPTQYPAS